jgi:hypothetical protein
MATRRAEHVTAGSCLCGRGGEGGWKRAGGYAAPGDRVHSVPAMEATAAVGWCGLARRTRHGGAVVRGGACRGGAGAATMERKAGGRHGREREAYGSSEAGRGAESQ